MRRLLVGLFFLGNTARAQGTLTFPLANADADLVHGWFYRMDRLPNGAWSGRQHLAIDYRTTRGQIVIAVCDGVAIATESQTNDRGVGAYGTFVLQRCNTPADNPLMVIYAHLENAHPVLIRRSRYNRDYTNWTPVQRGQVVGYAGDSGTSWVHLHFQVFTGHYGDQRRTSIDPYSVYSIARNYPGPCTDTLWTVCPPLPGTEEYADLDSDGYTVAEGDCLDSGMTPEGVPASAINPGAEEVCNGLDDNCDGQTDEEFMAILCGAVPAVCMAGILIECACCDGVDNDADGLIDNVDSDCDTYLCPSVSAHCWDIFLCTVQECASGDDACARDCVAAGCTTAQATFFTMNACILGATAPGATCGESCAGQTPPYQEACGPCLLDVCEEAIQGCNMQMC